MGGRLRRNDAMVRVVRVVEGCGCCSCRHPPCRVVAVVVVVVVRDGRLVVVFVDR